MIYLKNTNYGHLQVVKERLLVNVLPEDLSDRIEEAVKDRHQKKLILLTASQLSNKTVKLAVQSTTGIFNTYYLLNLHIITEGSSKTLLIAWPSMC